MKEKTRWSFETTEIKYALIISAAGFLWLLAEYAVGLHDKYIEWHPIITMFAIIIPIIGIRLAVKNKKKENNNELSYAEGFKTGSFIAVMSGVIAPVGQIIYNRWINPGWFEFMIEYSKKRAIESGMTGARLEQSVKYAESYFNERSYVLQSCFGTMVSGIIITAIVSYFLKTKK